MVGFKISIKKIPITLFAVVSFFSMAAQEVSPFEKLRDYRRSALTLGPAFFHAAQSRATSGTMAPENIPTWKISGGFEVDIRPNKQWSFVTGLIFVKESSYNIQLEIQKEDTPLGTSHFSLRMRDLNSPPTFSIPLLVTFKMPLRKSEFLEFRIGGKVKYFNPTWAIAEYRDINIIPLKMFELEIKSPHQFFYGSFLLGAGMIKIFNGFLIKTNLLYTLNFQDTFRGQYAFANLRVSGNSSGSYSLTGNNLSLMFSIAFKKPTVKMDEYY